MAMTPAEMVAFFSQQAAVCHENTRVNAIRSNPFLLCLNLADACRSHLMAALIAWRHALADPRDSIRSSVAVGVQASDTLLTVDCPTPLHERFRAFDTAFCIALLDESLPESVIKYMDAALQAADAESALDLMLARAVNGGDAHPFHAAAQSFRPSARTRLVHNTYLTYSELLSGNSRAIANAETNFQRRGSDDYFSGGVGLDGGGPDNKVTVDYRLAAIVSALKLDVPTIHRLPLDR